VIRGKEYGVSRIGCTTFTTAARKVLLSQFRFRVNERFLYEYDFGDLWQHQIRFEGIQPIREKKIYPVCVGGACAFGSRIKIILRANARASRSLRSRPGCSSKKIA
jgi:hypothetical protein